MPYAGDAAEKVVSMTMHGVEVAANTAGKVAFNLAAFLMAALKNREKSHGKASIKAFDGKPTKVFVMREADFKTFAQEAKNYGVVYAAIVNKKEKDGLVDVVINAKDAAKVNRISERYAISALETAVEKEPEQTPQQTPEQNPEQAAENKSEITADKPEEKEQTPKVEPDADRPTPARTEKENPFAHISTPKNSAEKEFLNERKSVKKEIAEICAQRKELALLKKQPAKSITHTQPMRKRKKEKVK